MCYSAEASFTAATVLGITGAYTLREAKHFRLLPMAMIPLMFGLQQLTEGVLWVSLSAGGQPGPWGLAAGYLYIFFAFMLWPVWFPLAAWILEDVTWRRRVMTAALLAGACVSVFNLWTLSTQEIRFEVVQNSVRYIGMHPSQWFLYLGALTLPYLVSSHSRLRIVGILAPISFCTAAYFHYVNFASIWCFWAAALSVIFYKLVKELAAEYCKTRVSQS